MLIALSVSMALEDAGHTVVLASNGAAGLEQAIATEPELILTDYMMPRMNGLQMIKALGQNGNVTPTILATAVATNNLVNNISGFTMHTSLIRTMKNHC